MTKHVHNFCLSIHIYRWRDIVNKKKTIPVKADDKDKIEALQTALQTALEHKSRATSDAAKLSSAAAVETAKANVKADAQRRFLEKHMFRTQPTAEALTTRAEKWADDIRRLEVDIRNRDENKEVALGTSKINYRDPRISVAWCKRCEGPIDKVFAKTLRDKFNWAMAVPPVWKFE